MPFHFEVSEATSGSIWIQNLDTPKAQTGNYLTFSPGIEVRQKAFNFEIIFTPYGNATNFKGGGLLGSSDWDAGSQALTFVTDKTVALADGYATTHLTFAHGLQFSQQNHFAFECNEAAVCAAFLNGVRNTEGASRFNGQKANIDRPLRGLMDQIGGTSNQTAWSQVTPDNPRLNWAEGVKIFAARIVTVDWLNDGSGAKALYATSGTTSNPFPQYINGANANSQSVLTSLSDVTGTKFLMSVGGGGITDSKSAGRTFTLGQSTTGNVTVLLPLTAQTVSFTSSAPSNLAVGSTYTPTTSSTSGLTPVVSVDSSSSAICSVSAGVVSAIGVGTCTLNLNQAGNSTYASAPQVQQSFTTRAAIAISGATISGTTNFGQVLTANPGTVTNASSYTASYQWRRDGTAISGAINQTYTLTSADIGSAISVQITVSDGSTSASASSSPTPNIAKATPTFSAWNNVPKNYGDSSFTVTAPTVTGSLDGTFSYSSANSSVISVSGSTFTVVGAGTSVITATFTPTDSTGYNTATTNMTVTVAKASLGVTASSHTVAFGAAVPTITPTYSGFVNGDTSSVISGTTCSTSYITTTPVGTIASSCTGATASNYSFTYTPGVITVTKAVQSAVTLSSLSAAYNSSNLTASLTGSGGSGTGSYTYSLDASNTTAGCAVNTSTLTYTTAGTCVIAVTRSSDTNFLSRTDAVSFTIGLASQTITFGSLSAKSYSSDTFTVSATSSASLTVVFTSGSPTICTTSGTSGSTITLLGVGTCIINANQAGDANTSAASQVSQNFTVNPRAITVTADAKSKSYGASDPTLTYTITTGSLVLGDALTGALSRAAGSDAGSYQIQQGALTSANNPKYAITFISADLTITRITPTLVLTYPNSNVAILRPGAIDTPTVTTSSSSGSLTFATTAASSICTVDSTTGVISLFGAGSCPVAMTTAQTTNYIQYTETTTVTIALLSTSLTGISQSNLVSMGNPFYAHASIDQSYSFSSGSNGASVAIPAGALDASVPISIHLLSDSTDQRALITSDGTSVLSVVVSWVAADGSVPNTNTGKAISVTLTNPAIKSGAKVYSIIGSQSQLLGTATADGSITTLITQDPVLLVINPVVTTPAPSSSSSGGGGGGYVMAVAVDNSAAIEAANLKLAADKAAAELKAAQEKKAAEEAEAAAIKAAKELADAQAQAAAELKASQDKAAEELRIAEELRLAQLKAEEDLKAAAAKKAAADIAAAARAMKPAVTLYSVSSTLKLSAYDSAYLAKYVRSLKNGAAVTCIGYTYGKSPASQASQTLAKRQANAVCTQMKKTNKTLRTSIVIYPASKAPKAAVGAKWVGVSYRIDGIKNP